MGHQAAVNLLGAIIVALLMLNMTTASALVLCLVSPEIKDELRKLLRRVTKWQQ